MNKEDLKVIMVYGSGIGTSKTDKKPGAFTGVSIACPFFKNYIEDENYYRKCMKKKNLTLLCEFVLDRFDNYLLLIGDSLLQYNFMAFYGMQEEEAMRRALKIGGYWFNFCEEEIKEFMPRVEVAKWSDLIKREESMRFVEVVKNYASKNVVFKAALRAMTITSIPSEFKEISKRCRKETLENALDLATYYSADEIAGLLYVHEETPFKIYVSKYEPNPLLKAIHGGHYPALSSQLGLTQYGHLQVSSYDKKIHCDDEFIEVYNAVKILGNLEGLMRR